MAKVTIAQAADMTGKSKSTIQRALKSGRLSYTIDDAGEREIDTSELERVYGKEKPATAAKAKVNPQAVIQAELQRAQDMLEMERVKMRCRSLEDQLHMTERQLLDMRDQRDQWQKQAQQLMITNQTTQKQAEDLKQEIREREARERAMRQRQMEERMRKQAQNQNHGAQPNGQRPAHPSAQSPAQAQTQPKSPSGAASPEPAAQPLWDRIVEKISKFRKAA